MNRLKTGSNSAFCINGVGPQVSVTRRFSVIERIILINFFFELQWIWSYDMLTFNRPINSETIHILFIR